MMGEAVTADFESIVRYSMALVQMKHAMRAGDLEAIKAWGSILNEEGQRVYGDDFNISYPTTEEELESLLRIQLIQHQYLIDNGISYHHLQQMISIR